MIFFVGRNSVRGRSSIWRNLFDWATCKALGERTIKRTSAVRLPTGDGICFIVVMVRLFGGKRTLQDQDSAKRPDLKVRNGTRAVAEA